MSVVTRDIAPGGDVYIVLRNPNAVSVIPIVELRKYGTDPPEYIPDNAMPALSPGHSPALKDDEAAEYRFRGPWKESVPSEETTSSEVLDQTPAVPIIREISTTDWNVHAFFTVLKIIHGRNNEVPRDASIKFITDVAVIVNYYECAESVALVAELWGSNKTLKGYGRASVMLLLVSFVFSWPRTFSSMARLVLEQGEGAEHVDTQDLDIGVIFERLDKERELLVPLIYRNLGQLRAGLLNKHGNKHDMQKELGSWDYEHKGVSVARVMDLLNCFPSPSWKDPKEKCPVHSQNCSVKALMKPTFDKIREGFENIKLADFQAKKV
ncbi:hypothetical protein FCOIX_6124 [Fusarium coicis]|nr:hypothetical protein FCOIX_6124 [Fusarium coicis]